MPPTTLNSEEPLNHAWNYLGVLVLMQITGDVRTALSISVWGVRWIS